MNERKIRCGWRRKCLNGSVRIDKTRIRNVSRPQMRNYKPETTGYSRRKKIEKNVELAEESGEKREERE